MRIMRPLSLPKTGWLLLFFLLHCCWTRCCGKSGPAHHVTDGRPRGIVHRYTCCILTGCTSKWTRRDFENKPREHNAAGTSRGTTCFFSDSKDVCCFGSTSFRCLFFLFCCKTDGRISRFMNNHDHKTIPCFTVGMGLQYLTILDDLDGIIIYEPG